MDRFAVEGGSTACIGRKQLIGTGIIYHTQFNLQISAKGDAHGKGGMSVDKVGGAIQRVNHPITLFALKRCHPLFCYKTCFGQYAFQVSHYNLFRVLIYIRHVVVSVLFFHSVNRKALLLLA